jgi:hypothetical protein
LASAQSTQVKANEQAGVAQASSLGALNIGHNLPQEAPQAFADAVIDVDRF